CASSTFTYSIEGIQWVSSLDTRPTRALTQVTRVEIRRAFFCRSGHDRDTQHRQGIVIRSCRGLVAVMPAPAASNCALPRPELTQIKLPLEAGRDNSRTSFHGRSHDREQRYPDL